MKCGAQGRYTGDDAVAGLRRVADARVIRARVNRKERRTGHVDRPIV